MVRFFNSNSGSQRNVTNIHKIRIINNRNKTVGGNIPVRILMLKDEPILQVEGFNVTILNYSMLPYALRYPDLNFDDIFHGWTEERVLNLSRSNAKQILAGFKLRQGNAYRNRIASLMHFATVTDCYWMKDDTEDIKFIHRKKLYAGINKSGIVCQVLVQR